MCCWGASANDGLPELSAISRGPERDRLSTPRRGLGGVGWGGWEAAGRYAARASRTERQVDINKQPQRPSPAFEGNDSTAP